ncbi:transcription factor S [Candidatus Woesearchaeota archaeon]|nr:transcription factor S [Candidatus Woesearchaeota archaeon]
MFCPKCGSILTIKNTGKKTVMGCSCGYIKKDKGGFEIKESVKKTKEIEVVEKDIQPDPITQVECPKCKNKEAYFWTVQTRASDEPETKFMKCVKCSQIWRDYN